MKSASQSLAITNGWPQAAAISITSVVILLLAYYVTSASTVAIWSRSETFAHGFLIFPISAYLIWTRRRQIAALAPESDIRGVFLLALLGLGWLAADLARVLVVQQLALVAMIPALVFTLLGWRVTWAMAFPLAYLLLAGLAILARNIGADQLRTTGLDEGFLGRPPDESRG